MTSPVNLIHADKLGDLPPTETLGDTHLIARGLNVIYGPSGAYKSFYALSMALLIAQQSPVIYIAAEGSSGFHKRILAWSDYHGLGAGQLHFLCQEVNLLDPTKVRKFSAAAGALKPALVIFDTYARCIPGGDENSSRDAGIAILHTAEIQRQLDCAAVWVHHANRAERGERGSGAMRGGADAMIELTASGDVIRVICSKLKDDEPWPTEELQFQSIGASGILLPADYANTHHFSTQELQILELLSLEVFETSGAKAQQIGNALNISERHIYRMLSHLKSELTLTHDSKGDPYRLTDKGKTLICKPSAKNGKVISLVKTGTYASTDTSDWEVTV